MYEIGRRSFLKSLGKATAALGIGMSLGAGCAKEEPKKEVAKGALKGAPPAGAPKSDLPGARFTAPGVGTAKGTVFRIVPEPIPKDGKTITALSFGSKNGQCETFLRAAAVGAGELGVKTELIRVVECNVQHLEARAADDVNWIHEKALLEDTALITAVPCYHIRANALLYTVNERMLGVRGKNPWISDLKRPGAVIGVGGSGYDAWASLTNISTSIFLLHSRTMVDMCGFFFNALREWNLWMHQGKPMTQHTHLARMIDTPPEKFRTIYPGEPQVEWKEWYTMAVERAKQMGRNVAKAMSMPIEQVKYMGEKSDVECPWCHNNVLIVQEKLPHVGCPICWNRGMVKMVGGEMKVEWRMEDLKLKRFDREGQIHHGSWIKADEARRREHKDWQAEYRNQLWEASDKFVKIVTPPTSA